MDESPSRGIEAGLIATGSLTSYDLAQFATDVHIQLVCTGTVGATSMTTRTFEDKGQGEGEDQRI